MEPQVLWDSSVQSEKFNSFPSLESGEEFIKTLYVYIIIQIIIQDSVA